MNLLVGAAIRVRSSHFLNSARPPLLTRLSLTPHHTRHDMHHSLVDLPEMGDMHELTAGCYRRA